MTSLLFSLFVTSVSWASLRSPFPSSIPRLDIPNSHFLRSTPGAKNSLIRGMAPTESQISDLLNLGVTDFLIFKNETRNEVRKEVAFLRRQGVSKHRIYNIAFRWKGFKNFREPCIQTLQALAILYKISELRSGRSLFFHCTVGEDRTGYLAGIYRYMTQEQTLHRIFESEMCQKGYSRGNPNKPSKVTSAIRKDLTPLFLKMISLVDSGVLSVETLKKLSRSRGLAPPICSQPARNFYDKNKFKCRPQNI